MDKKIQRTVFFLVAVVLLTSCGKSEQELQLESKMSADVAERYKAVKNMKLGETLQNVEAAILRHDSLVTFSPKNARMHKSDDLKEVVKKLQPANKMKKEWMANYKPYDEKMPHNEAVALLNKQVDDLAVMKTSHTALTDEANSALGKHSEDAAKLKKAMPARKKK